MKEKEEKFKALLREDKECNEAREALCSSINQLKTEQELASRKLAELEESEKKLL